jgi:hypothetical protein
VTTGDWFGGLEMPPRISDHFPVGVDMTFSAQASPVATAAESVTAPTALAYECPLPPEARQN